MARIDFFKPIRNVRNFAKAQFINPRVAKLNEQIEGLLAYQALIIDDILTVGETGTTYKGNEYQTYETAVEEIAKKYDATADWGVLQTGNIIDIRAAFIIAQGVQVVRIDEAAEDEEAFAQDFIKFNKFDREAAQEFAKEAEIEGKILMKLDMEKGDEMVSARFVSWSAKRYKIKTDPSDYLKYEEAYWTEEESGKTDERVSLEPPNFVYRKFGGRINKPNNATPKIMKCLTQIDGLDKALRDWREINHLFGSPVPHIEVEDSKKAVAIQERIDKINWKIRKLFVHTGKLDYLVPDISGAESIEKEISALAKMISGTTGVPIHFLGLTDLLKQVATAKNLMELIQASTSKEREIWKSTYEEGIRKAMMLFNESGKSTKYKKKLDPEKIGVDIQVISKEQFEQVEKVWLPAYIANAITLDLLLSKLPGVDVAEEKKRREEEDKNELKDVKDQLDEANKTIKDKETEAALGQRAGEGNTGGA